MRVARIVNLICCSLKSQSRCFSNRVTLTNEEIKKKRNTLFDEEVAKQKSYITRVEKIQVDVKGPPEDCTLIMNKEISTPYNCAMHISEVVTKRSVLAMVNGQLWDMHSPLKDNCSLEFLHFKQEDPWHVNKVFWRSCSFLLGLLIERSFRNEFNVELHSWPAPNVRSGCFVYDADLKMDEWQPSRSEIQVLNTIMRKFCAQNYPFHHLEVDVSLAMKIFEDNRFKKEQIPQIAAESATKNKVKLYRVDDHIDISCGPMIANANIVNMFNLAAVHIMQTSEGVLHRFQGVALPSQLYLNNYAVSLLVKRAAKLYNQNIPGASTIKEKDDQVTATISV